MLIFEDLIRLVNLFDIIFFIILIYFVIQCFLKGFSLSLISSEMDNFNNCYDNFSAKINSS